MKRVGLFAHSFYLHIEKELYLESLDSRIAFFTAAFITKYKIKKNNIGPTIISKRLIIVMKPSNSKLVFKAFTSLNFFILHQVYHIYGK